MKAFFNSSCSFPDYPLLKNNKLLLFTLGTTCNLYANPKHCPIFLYFQVDTNKPDYIIATATHRNNMKRKETKHIFFACSIHSQVVVTHSSFYVSNTFHIVRETLLKHGHIRSRTTLNHIEEPCVNKNWGKFKTVDMEINKKSAKAHQRDERTSFLGILK